MSNVPAHFKRPTRWCSQIGIAETYEDAPVLVLKCVQCLILLLRDDAAAAAFSKAALDKADGAGTGALGEFANNRGVPLFLQVHT